MLKATEFKAGELLQKINSPEDLRKKFKQADLPKLAQELREFIVDIVSVKGGHFGSSLGVVELTIAMHYVFNTPFDQLIWDVGHQAYGHKILTGRRDQFYTNRKLDGLSGFPSRKESEYDTFGTGHSSTSISAALGMAVASRLKKEIKRKHIAVIGDGALTAGMAFEALNNATEEDDFLVILNDNCMSIDPNVGALQRHLIELAEGREEQQKEKLWSSLGKLSNFGQSKDELISKLQKRVNKVLKNHGNIFEILNFQYFGPVDGHDIDALIENFKIIKNIKGPKILHVLTVKGKGYKLAEKEQTKWHAPGIFNKETGEIIKAAHTEAQPPKYQDVFGESIIELANENEKIVGVTPAMPTGCSLDKMMKLMPDRVFDVGIAEQHAVTFSAGLATQGLLPFCNIYSTFMQRAYDQLIHDVALQKLNVIFFLDRAGIAGADGPTHHGAFDLAYMRLIPNLIISAPMNEEELRNLMFTAQSAEHGPFSIRYPRGKGVMPEWKTAFRKVEIGKGRKIRDGKHMAILSIGHIGNYALLACQKLEKEYNIEVAHYDLRFLKPLDVGLLHEIFSAHKQLITIEDGCIAGGMGSAILEFASENGYTAEIKRLGMPDEFVLQGTQDELYKLCGMDTNAIINAVLEIVKR